MVYTITQSELVVVKESRSVFKEIFISFLVSIPFFTLGIETISLTSSVHAGYFVSSERVKWSTTAFVLAAAVSSPVFCVLSNRLGRKMGLFFINIIQGASLIPLFLMNSTNTIIFHVLAGSSSAGLFTILPVFITEITSPCVRGHCLTMIAVMTSAGYMMEWALNLEQRMYLMTALVMTQLIVMVWVVESPSYLVMRGKFEKAQRAIISLRMVTENSTIATKELEILKKESDRAKASGKITLITVYRNKIWWDAIKIVTVLCTAKVLCGSIVFLDQDKTLQQLKMGGDPHSVLVLAAMMGGSLTAAVLIWLLDRKYLLTLGFTIMALSCGIIAVYTQVDLTVSNLHWLAVTALVVLVVGFGMAWSLPMIITAEIFNFEVRTTIISSLFTYGQLLKLLHVHTFQHLETYVGVYTLFYIFATINLYGAVYTLFAVPNIKNKSIRQIEKQLKRPPLPA